VLLLFHGADASGGGTLPDETGSGYGGWQISVMTAVTLLLAVLARMTRHG